MLGLTWGSLQGDAAQKQLILDSIPAGRLAQPRDIIGHPSVVPCALG